jgi:transcriptional antiterminator NusG
MEDRFRDWHLVQVSDGLDSVTVDFLKRVGVLLYRPLMRSMQLVPRKKLSRKQRTSALRPVREKIAPLFPGYAFVTFAEAGERWREVFKIAHIRGLVCANGLPASVSWDLIDRLQRREVDGAVPASIKLTEFPFPIGSRVRVNDGPFASFPGMVSMIPRLDGVDWENATLDDIDESVRLEILVDIFGRPTPVALALSQIEKL